jgi:hypothetical protein
MKIQKFILDEVLGKVLIKYITNDYTPVVVGGTTLHKCSKTSINDDTDIDIKFVRLNETISLYEVVFIKMQCIEEILKLYNSAKPEEFPTLQKTASSKKYNYRQSLFYMEGDKRKVMIDMTVNDTFDQTNAMLRAIHTSFVPTILKNDSRYIIPFRIQNNIPWADCNWVYLDTIRMIFTSWDLYKNSKGSKDKMFFAHKTLKYLMKIIHMKVHYKKQKRFTSFLAKINKMLESNDVSINEFKALMLTVQKKTDINELNKHLQAITKLQSEISFFINSVRLLIKSTPTKERVPIIKSWFNSNKEEHFPNLKLTFKGNGIYLDNIHILNYKG